MTTFMKAALGFETNLMRQASDLLAEAETTAQEYERRAQRDPAAYKSELYAQGAEYALCSAMAQLMSAVVAVMSESLTESLRGFYKLRKAYVTLDAIISDEGRYMESRPSSRPATPGGSRLGSMDRTRSPGVSPTRSGQFPMSARSKLSHVSKGDGIASQSAKEGYSPSDDDSDDFEDANESHGEGQLPAYAGNLEFNGGSQKTNGAMSDDEDHKPTHEDLPPFAQSRSFKGIERLMSYESSSEIFTHPIDIFVHSGTNLCYGLLLTLLSLIPPSFGRLLSIIGFRGDRERGLRMLWQASKFHNVNGAMAGLTLFAFYNEVAGSCDILPDPRDHGAAAPVVTGYPTPQLEVLLADMRGRFPQSKIWLLESARMQSVRRDIAGGLHILSGDIRSPLKQVHALAVFERSLQAMFAHDYELCSASFQECMRLNDWSPALQIFNAGVARVELYRAALRNHPQSPDTKKLPKDAEAHAKKATELLQKVRAHAGRKKFLARQLPLEAYVTHCLTKWETRAKTLRIPLIDAIGTSPLETMIFMWSGHKKMNAAQLRAALAALDYRPAGARLAETVDAVDERASRAVLRAACLRSLGETAEGKALLREDVLAHDRATFKAPGRDDWMLPAAHYEMAAARWAERRGAAGEGNTGPGSTTGASESERVAVREAQEQLETAARWERFMLDNRIGVRVQTGLDTVRRWRAEHDLTPVS